MVDRIVDSHMQHEDAIRRGRRRNLLVNVWSRPAIQRIGSVVIATAIPVGIVMALTTTLFHRSGAICHGGTNCILKANQGYLTAVAFILAFVGFVSPRIFDWLNDRTAAKDSLLLAADETAHNLEHIAISIRDGRLRFPPLLAVFHAQQFASERFTRYAPQSCVHLAEKLVRHKSGLDEVRTHFASLGDLYPVPHDRESLQPPAKAVTPSQRDFLEHYELFLKGFVTDSVRLMFEVCSRMHYTHKTGFEHFDAVADLSCVRAEIHESTASARENSSPEVVYFLSEAELDLADRRVVCWIQDTDPGSNVRVTTLLPSIQEAAWRSGAVAAPGVR